MSVIFFPRRLTGPACANGMRAPHPPARDIADLPADLRDRVLAARDALPVEPHQPEPPEAA